MSTAMLDRVIEEVKELTPAEQDQLRKILDSLLARSSAQMTKDSLEQRLLKKGIISRIPPRIHNTHYYANRKPIEVEGKPVSEIIIEERR